MTPEAASMEALSLIERCRDTAFCDIRRDLWRRAVELQERCPIEPVQLAADYTSRQVFRDMFPRRTS